MKWSGAKQRQGEVQCAACGDGNVQSRGVEFGNGRVLCGTATV